MATVGEWIEGARPRTLPAATAPVLAGTAIAIFEHSLLPGRAMLALLVALALQIGVNFANDYSDGIRGSDEVRVGPMRLVGSGAASPGQVKAAAFGCFGVAAVAGLGLVILTRRWWLLFVGVASILAAWFYTGGKRPYGYAGFGEVFVFIFFGLVAVGGTSYVQIGRVPLAAWMAGVWMGALACAILVANNLRDIDGDRRVGKRTLATRLGKQGTRRFLIALCVVAWLMVGAVALLTTPWALLAWVMTPWLVRAATVVARGAAGTELVGALADVGRGQLAGSLGLILGCWIGA